MTRCGLQEHMGVQVAVCSIRRAAQREEDA